MVWGQPVEGVVYRDGKMDPALVGATRPSQVNTWRVIVLPPDRPEVQGMFTKLVCEFEKPAITVWRWTKNPQLSALVHPPFEEWDSMLILRDIIIREAWLQADLANSPA